MVLTKRGKNLIDKRVEEIVRRRCSGLSINVMDIGKVFDAAYAAVIAGADVEAAVVAKYNELAAVA